MKSFLLKSGMSRLGKDNELLHGIWIDLGGNRFGK